MHACIQIVPTLQRLVDSLRTGGPEMRLVPFPMLQEGSQGVSTNQPVSFMSIISSPCPSPSSLTSQGLYTFWRPSLEAYYFNLIAFLELVRLA